MGYEVKFWTLTKKSNSTLVPTTGATAYDCIIKTGSGILNPKVELNIGLVNDPSQFNYAYIAAFERYYYVNEWTFERGLWTANMSVDVLATYKTQIGSASLYVLRASASYDGNIVDNLYPVKAGCTFDNSTISNPYNFNLFGSTGAPQFCIGCVSDEGNIGSLNYYMVTADSNVGLGKICNYLLNDAVSVVNNFDLADASLALQNSLIDPIQYIKSAVMIPFTTTEYADVSTGVAPVKVYTWSTGATGLKIDRGTTITKSFTFNLKKHPDTSSRGNYVNSAPYTLITLSFPPFGIIELDTSVTCNATSLIVDVACDVISGKGKLSVRCQGTVLQTLEAQLGVPVQLSQVSSDYMGAITSVASGFGNIAKDIFTGNMSNVISGIGNAIQALTPREKSVGGGGSFTQLTGHFALYYQFFRPVDDDINHNGRPYCQVTTPATLGGYMLIQDGDVAIPGTKEEADQIRTILESGFYYE